MSDVKAETSIKLSLEAVGFYSAALNVSFRSNLARKTKIGQTDGYTDRYAQLSKPT